MTALKVLLLLFVFEFLSISFLPVYADTTSEQSVSVTVPPRAENFQVDITHTSTGSIVPRDSKTFVITYGSTVGSNIPLTIVADWSAATGEGINILDYVSGSATNAYGQTPGVVDLVNHKITWTISSFPAELQNQVVEFSLQANSYVSTTGADLPITAYVTSLSVTASKQTTQRYVNTPSSSSPTSTPTPGPLTPTPSNVSLTPTPTAAQNPIQITTRISQITATSSTINFLTSHQSRAKLMYGTTIDRLTESTTDSSLSRNHTFQLPNLTPETTYFVKGVFYDKLGNQYQSDIYTIKTAAVSIAPIIDLSTIVLSSQGNIIYSASQLEKTQTVNHTGTNTKTPEVQKYDFSGSQ